MGGADEEWVKAAMSDDAMVVEILVRLHHAPSTPPRPLLKRSPFPLAWSVRQRRSKSTSANRNPKKSLHGHRGSPTTPLSWSGATSFSGGSAGTGAAGSEDSIRPTTLKLSSTSRSKVNVDSEKTNSKRSRKKKTLAELKNEENLLVKERRELKREMANLRLYLETLRATNGNLKRMKVELQPRLEKQLKPPFAAEELASTSGQLPPEVATAHCIPTEVPPSLVTASDFAQKKSRSRSETEAKFILPDLNMPSNEPGCFVI